MIGLAGGSNHDWLTRHGVIPVAYGDGVADRIREARPRDVTAFIDTYGGDYVELALNELGVPPERVDTIVRFDAVAKYGVKAEATPPAPRRTLGSWPASSRPRSSRCRSRRPTR